MAAGQSRTAVVIGGGITGTLCAHALLQEGWAVTVLEGEHLGAGSSSRTAAGIRQQFSTRDTVVGMRHSVRFYRDWSAHTGGDQSPIVQRGYLFLHDAPDAWAAARARVADQHSWGLADVEALDADALGERFDWVEPQAVLGGTWCASDGFLRPELIYTDAADACRRDGGAIVLRAPVVEARHAGGRLQAVRTPKGWFGADLFLDCTNAWTRRVGEILGSHPLPVAAFKRYLWFIDRGQAMDAERFMQLPLVIAPGGTYFRPENPSSLMVGWAHEAKDQAGAFTYEDQDVAEEAYYHASGVDARPFHAWMNVADVVPEAMDFAGITATTSGFYGTTPDHNPFLDFDPRIPNLLRLVGFSGHGAMFGPFTALVGAALAEAGARVDQVDVLGTQASIHAFRIGRPYEHHEAMVI